jgi:flagellar biosynthetic protein FliQ
MSQEMVLQIMQQIFYTTALLALPILGVTFLIGIGMSIFQAVTNIQEQTLVFIPKMIAVMVVLFFAMPWMFRTLAHLTVSFFDYMLAIARH